MSEPVRSAKNRLRTASDTKQAFVRCVSVVMYLISKRLLHLSDVSDVSEPFFSIC